MGGGRPRAGFSLFFSGLGGFLWSGGAFYAVATAFSYRSCNNNTTAIAGAFASLAWADGVCALVWEVLSQTSSAQLERLTAASALANAVSDALRFVVDAVPEAGAKAGAGGGAGGAAGSEQRLSPLTIVRFNEATLDSPQRPGGAGAAR